MKLTESQLRKIIREELKAVRADQLYITEMIGDTGSAGDEAGGSSLEDKKKQCANSGGKWVEEEGGYGHCQDIKKLEETDRLESAKFLEAHKLLKNALKKLGWDSNRWSGRTNPLAWNEPTRKGFMSVKDPDHFLRVGNEIVKGTMTPEEAAKELIDIVVQRKAQRTAAGGPMDEEKTDPVPLRMIFLDDEVNAAIAAGKSSRAARGIPDPTPERIRTRLNSMLGQKAGEGIASYQGTSGSPKRKLMIRTAIRAYENEYTKRKRR